MSKRNSFLGIGCCVHCGRLFEECECDDRKRRDRLLDQSRKKRKASQPGQHDAPQKSIKDNQFLPCTAPAGQGRCEA